jgi:hypothetical protein
VSKKKKVRHLLVYRSETCAGNSKRNKKFFKKVAKKLHKLLGFPVGILPLHPSDSVELLRIKR